VNIRRLRDDDKDRIVKIAPRAFMGMGLARLSIDKTLPKGSVKRAYEREVEGYIEKALRGEGDIKFLVAEEDGLPVGYIVLGVSKERTEIFGFKWGMIVSLAVDPDWWGKGIGTKLVEEGLKQLRDMGVEYVEVFTDQNNIAAIRTYEKNGFRVIYSGILLSQYLETIPQGKKQINN